MLRPLCREYNPNRIFRNQNCEMGIVKLCRAGGTAIPGCVKRRTGRSAGATFARRRSLPWHARTTCCAARLEAVLLEGLASPYEM